jgi:hypothetical protein
MHRMALVRPRDAFISRTRTQSNRFQYRRSSSGGAGLATVLSPHTVPSYIHVLTMNIKLKASKGRALQMHCVQCSWLRHYTSRKVASSIPN